MGETTALLDWVVENDRPLLTSFIELPWLIPWTHESQYSSFAEGLNSVSS